MIYLANFFFCSLKTANVRPNECVPNAGNTNIEIFTTKLLTIYELKIYEKKILVLQNEL